MFWDWNVSTEDIPSSSPRLSFTGLLQDRGGGVSEGPASREDSDGEVSGCFYRSDSAYLGPHLMGCTGQLGCTGVWTAELGLINMAL